MERWSVDVMCPDGSTRRAEFRTRAEALRAVAMHFEEGAEEVVIRVRPQRLLASPPDDREAVH